MNVRTTRHTNELLFTWHSGLCGGAAWFGAAQTSEPWQERVNEYELCSSGLKSFCRDVPHDEFIRTEFLPCQNLDNAPNVPWLHVGRHVSSEWVPTLVSLWNSFVPLQRLQTPKNMVWSLTTELDLFWRMKTIWAGYCAQNKGGCYPNCLGVNLNRRVLGNSEINLGKDDDERSEDNNSKVSKT